MDDKRSVKEIDAIVSTLTKHHTPTPEQIARVTEIRAATHIFIYALIKNCPAGSDRDQAILNARTAMMFANTSVIVPKVTI